MSMNARSPINSEASLRGDSPKLRGLGKCLEASHIYSN